MVDRPDVVDPLPENDPLPGDDVPDIPDENDPLSPEDPDGINKP